VAVAHQFSPVSCDPAGAISPDGRWIAYEGLLRVRSLRVVPSSISRGEAQIRNIAWSSDSRSILADGFQTQSGWALYDRVDGTRRPLWSDRDPLGGAKVSDLRQPAWSSDGRSVAAIVNGRDGQDLWTIAADGSSAHAQRMAHRIAFPAWTPRGLIACVTTTDGRMRLTIPCGGDHIVTEPDLDVYGPVAFSPDAATVYLSFANASGTLDLWSVPGGGRARRLTSFSRDVCPDRLQRRRRILQGPELSHFRGAGRRRRRTQPSARHLSKRDAVVESGGPTPRHHLAHGAASWTMKYPDIAQDAGIIVVDPANPAASASSVVHASASEDQGAVLVAERQVDRVPPHIRDQSE
jgi:hypothetical protein